jgi:hypothetical protein
VVYAGETVEARLVLEQPDGAGGWEPQDLTDRVFVQRIVYANGTVLASVTGQNTIDQGEAIVVFTLDGDVTADLLPDGASEALLRHEVSEVLESGRDVLLEEAFTVLRGAGNAGLPTSTTPPSSVAFRMRDRMIVRYIGARGPSGLVLSTTEPPVVDGQTVLWLKPVGAQYDLLVVTGD